jgi:hypothetical protein
MTNGTRKRWGVSDTPRPLFTPGKDPVPSVQEAGWAPGPFRTGAENLASTEIRSLDRPVRTQSLYRLRFPAHGFGEEVWELIYVSPFLAQISNRKIRNTNLYWCPRLLRSVGLVSTPPYTLLMCCPGKGAVVISVMFFIDGHVNGAVWMSYWQSLPSLEMFPLVCVSQ